MKELYLKYQSIINDNTISNKNKIILLQQIKNDFDKKLAQQQTKDITKFSLGALLQIASAGIPMGGVGKFGAQTGLNLLKQRLGRKISQEIGSGVTSGLVSGGLFGLGRGISENKNPLTSTIQDALIGGISGGILGASGANIQKSKIDYKLKNIKPERWISGNDVKILRKLGKQYYNDYLHDLKIKTTNGELINFPNSKAGEINLHNYKMLPQIPKQIKSAKNIITSNDKYRKDAYNFDKIYNVYNGKNYEYIIRNNSNNSGKDFYQIKEVGPASAYSHQNRALETKPNTIIQNNFPNFNSNGTDLNKIFTREDIAKMSNDDFIRNEKAIMQQLKEIGIPTNQELKVYKNQTASKNNQSSKNGHWVTIKGNHVFIDD